MQIRFPTKIPTFLSRSVILITASGIALALLLYFTLFKDLGPYREKKIAILINSDFQGERSFAHRIQAASENLHWEADIFNVRNFKRLKKHRYDFVITLVPGFNKFRSSKYYLTLFHPLYFFFKKDGSLKERYKNYDGYLLTYSPSLDDPNFSSQKLPYIRWYPTVQAREYKEVNPTHLFHLACVWGNRFDDPKMHQFLNLMDREAFTCTYGNSLTREHCPQSYRSFIPYDSNALYEIANNCGVTLIIHSAGHNAHGLPSGRIFEAAAASTVIICDENPFVKEHFGDSVLYINTQESAESMHNQIVQHMSWIQANKKAALEKAKTSYAIYKDRFLLEEQLLRLSAFHDQLSQNIFLNWAKKVRLQIRETFFETKARKQQKGESIP